MSETKQTQGREEEADAALRNTKFSYGTACFIVVAFVLSLIAVPFVQYRNRAGAPPPKLTNGEVRWPRADELQTYEKSLESRSTVLSSIRPKAQAVLTGKLGTGNEQVWVGADGWLFLRQSIDSIAAEGFMEPDVLKRRRQQGEDSPDALKVILDFKSQLAKRGIGLMVMPVPEKPTIYPEKLWPEHSLTDEPPRNASFDQFKRTLEANDIIVYDPTPTLLRAKNRYKVSQYFPTDTHWTPVAVELAARDLANIIGMFKLLPERMATPYRRGNGAGSDPSDLVRKLGLPKKQTLYAPVRVASRPVFSLDGRPCEADINSDVLILGDSFSGVYEEGAAGLVQQMSFYLSRPVDHVGVPNGGSWAARFELRKEMLHGRDHLTGKKLVIYEFICRDLSFGSWKPMQLPNLPHKTQGAVKTVKSAKVP